MSSKRGVWGLLGILKCRGDDPPEVEVADVGVSAERYAGVLDKVKLRLFPLGGDCGGSIVTAGGIDAAGFARKARVGDGDKLTWLLVRRG